jgi:hypothetical protein
MQIVFWQLEVRNGSYNKEFGRGPNHGYIS